MKRILNIALLLTLIVSNNACQTRTFFEEIEKDKSQSFERNLIVFYSEIPAEFIVSFSKKKNDKENIVIEQAITTPYILDMGEVIIKYDSLNFVRKPDDKILEGVRRIKRNFSKNGSEYFMIKNNSNQDIEFSVVGNQPLKLKYLETYGAEILNEYPKPIYKGVPILYLLKPTSAQKNKVNVKLLNKEGDGYIKSISLLGDFGQEALPFSISQIMKVYREDKDLYYSYLDYFNNRFYDREDMLIYGVVKPREKYVNKGRIPFFQKKFSIINEF